MTPHKQYCLGKIDNWRNICLVFQCIVDYQHILHCHYYMMDCSTALQSEEPFRIDNQIHKDTHCSALVLNVEHVLARTLNNESKIQLMHTHKNASSEIVEESKSTCR